MVVYTNKQPHAQKRIQPESRMFQQMVEFFFIVTATGNRDKHEKIRGQGRKKKSVGFCHRKNPPPEKREFFFLKLAEQRKK
ncbi:Uncharacterized protein APZ42_024528 [Daphnia magna]|uniref:Uncharacterized protein n=1 Tax=Daphnia magna TaxID=35525 RepID=A0A164TXE4_9CRUS|nr:Uncharacterized protein APZ42_024528 [Daphnia magna]